MANSQTISSTPVETAESEDPALCRVSGYLRDIQGNVLKGYGLTLRHVYDPIGIAPATLVLRERITILSDRNGYVQFDLLRGAKVNVELPNRLADHVHRCTVPDAASVSLVDFLTPYLVSAAWVLEGVQSLEVGAGLEVSLIATLSDGSTVPVPACAVTLTSSDDDILLVVSNNTVFGASAGDAELSVEIDSAEMGLLVEGSGTAINILSLPTPEMPTALSFVVS